MSAWAIQEVRGAEAERFVEGLASLRIRVFRDFPYLYDGTMEYERKYLRTYFNSCHSFVALCFSESTLVGASTAIALSDEEESFQKPFIEAGLKPERICYYGESVLLPEMRGLGIGKAFMEARERFALSLNGVSQAAFCAVVRKPNHPLRPKDYRPLDPFWERSGFRRIPGMLTSYSWKDVGENRETAKTMQFWLKDLEEK